MTEEKLCGLWRHSPSLPLEFRGAALSCSLAALAESSKPGHLRSPCGTEETFVVRGLNRQVFTLAAVGVYGAEAWECVLGVRNLSLVQGAAGEDRSEQSWLKVPAVSTALGDPILHPP